MEVSRLQELWLAFEAYGVILYSHLNQLSWGIQMSATKQTFKIGEMIIDQKQIFWKMQYCYALIPIYQILDGRTFFLTQMSWSVPSGPLHLTLLSSQLKCSTYRSLPPWSPSRWKASMAARPPISIFKTAHNNLNASRWSCMCSLVRVGTRRKETACIRN